MIRFNEKDLFCRSGDGLCWIATQHSKVCAKGVPSVFYAMGEAYEKSFMYLQAYEMYAQAERVMRENGADAGGHYDLFVERLTKMKNRLEHVDHAVRNAVN
jgi:hypothetical protein